LTAAIGEIRIVEVKE